MASLEDTLKKLNSKKKDEDRVSVLGEKELTRTTTSTGSVFLDHLTGGGYMNGGYNYIVASGGVGKSSMALLSCQDVISKTGKTAVYFDAEGTLTDSYFSRMNVDKSKFIHRRGRNLESMLDEAELFAQSEDVGIIVFDSIPIFVASSVEAKSSFEHSIGVEASKFTKRMPIIEGFASARDICLLGLTSYKLNPGSMGDPRVISRGEWQKTMSNTILDMTKKDILVNGNKKVIGHQIDVRVKKSKNSSYNGSEVKTVNFFNQGGFDNISEYARLLCEIGVVSVGGAGWITFSDSNGEENKIQGVENFSKYLNENPQDLEFLKQFINE